MTAASSTATHSTPPLRPLPVDALLDPLTGIIRNVESVLTPDVAPPAYTSMTASVADARALGDWPADRVSLGTTFGDPAGARMAAIGEAVERYCGNYLPPEFDPTTMRVTTRRALLADGERVIELDALPQWQPWQYERPGFEYTVLTDDVETLWVRCELADSPEREPVWWPSALVHLNWRQGRLRHLPRVFHLNYAGIATGQGVEDATNRAVLELIERDALELWWHLDRPAYGIDPDSVPGLRAAMSGCPLTLWLVQMPSAFAPSVAALVHDPETGLYAAGFSCKNEAAEAARKAALEAVHTWIYTRGTQHADGWVYQAIEAGLMAKGLHFDHRADARYLDSAGDVMQHVRDLGAHVQVWQDERVHHLAKRFTQPARGMRSVQEIPTVSHQQVRDRLADAGLQVHRADLTTSDVALTSLRVVRAFVPGLVPNAPAAFAYLGCDRFRQAAEADGIALPTTPSEWTLAPAPHM